MEKLRKMTKAATNGIELFAERDWTKTEKVFLMIDCVLVGILLGAIWSPKREKHVIMGSYNSGNGCGNTETEEKK